MRRANRVKSPSRLPPPIGLFEGVAGAIRTKISCHSARAIECPKFLSSLLLFLFSSFQAAPFLFSLLLPFFARIRSAEAEEGEEGPHELRPTDRPHFQEIREGETRKEEEKEERWNGGMGESRGDDRKLTCGEKSASQKWKLSTEKQLLSGADEGEGRGLLHPNATVTFKCRFISSFSIVDREGHLLLLLRRLEIHLKVFSSHVPRLKAKRPSGLIVTTPAGHHTRESPSFDSPHSPAQFVLSILPPSPSIPFLGGGGGQSSTLCSRRWS